MFSKQGYLTRWSLVKSCAWLKCISHFFLLFQLLRCKQIPWRDQKSNTNVEYILNGKPHHQVTMIQCHFFYLLIYIVLFRAASQRFKNWQSQDYLITWFPTTGNCAPPFRLFRPILTCIDTVCPRSTNPFYLVIYFINLATTSWTYII